MANFCTTCGSKTYPDSLFCESCGSKLTPSTSSGINLSPQENNYRNDFTKRSSVSQYPSSTPQYPYRRKSHKRLGWVIGIIIISVIGFSLLTMFFTGFIPLLNPTFSHEYVGSHDYTITDNFTKLDIIIDNSVGSVNVFYVENASITLDAQIHVYAKNQKDLYGSEIADVGTYEADHLYFQFTPYSVSSWNSDYHYDIDLLLSPKLESNLQIDVSTGSIMVDASDTVIGEVFLETSTGSIEAYFTNVEFNNSEYSFYQVDTSTGSVNTHFHNVTYTDMSNNPQWMISTSTGSVNFEIFQETAVNSTLDIEYDVSAFTGSITCNYGFHGDIGYYLDASTSLGDIMVEGFNSSISFPYTSEKYQTTTIDYILILSTSTGSIEIFNESA
jgi:hypothetical protein